MTRKSQSQKIHTFASMQALVKEAADKIIHIANEAIDARGVFCIALAGGSTPKGVYELLASEDYKSKTDWSKWRVYFGDERLVPLDDERSNYKMAQETLLKNVPLNEKNIYIPPVDPKRPEVAAAAYEKMIIKSFATLEVPRFDLILLGLGSDGHTASLFPGKEALKITDRLVAVSSLGILPPPVLRVTFTFPLINAARHIIFLASGIDKAPAFKAALDGSVLNGEQAPAYLVGPNDGELEWLVTSDLEHRA